MKPDDKLIITLETYSANREVQILEQYKLPSILKLFNRSLSLIGIHNSNYDEFEFIYNKKNSTVEVYFLANKWISSPTYKNINLDFPLPNKIKIFSTFRPTQTKLKSLLDLKGFKIEIFHYFKRDMCCGVVCRVQ